MKNKFKYLLNLIKTLIWPVVFTIGYSFVNFIFVCIFNNSEKGTMDNNEFLKYIKTDYYKTKLNNYITNNSIFIILIVLIILFPIFYKILKKYKKENNFKVKNIFFPIVLGVSISLIYNITIYNLNNIFNFTNAYKPSNIPLMIQLVCSGILGPVIEEILFRGIVYNKLKSFNKPMTSIILCSLIFSLMHSNIIDMVYAFGVSFMFIYLYEKYKTLKAPIIMHMSLNITIILMLKLITYNFLIFNSYLVIISIISLLLCRFYIKKDV
ncbi:MAG: CPBP family intramembrane metalloprotease [bacterium]|nr:CPBP family intramembrane metalloprotease [bacterium]